MNYSLDPNVPTREIMWNIGTLPNVIALYGLLALTLIIAANGIFSRTLLWNSGTQSSEHWGSWLKRIDDFLANTVFQKRVRKGGKNALAHIAVYIGFMVLLFATTMVFIHHDLGIKIYQGNFYLGVTLAADVFGFGLLLGCVYFAHRRYVSHADNIHNRRVDSCVLAALALMCIQGFFLEAFRIHVTRDPWAFWSPVGLITSKFFWFLSNSTAAQFHYFTWWFHTLTVYAFLALLPYTKFFHIISSSVNLFFDFRKRPKGALSSPGDIAQMIEAGQDFSLGLSTLADYPWKNILDLDACTQCGRCQEVCPAYISGKPLSPKWVILDTRNHALALHSEKKMPYSKKQGVLGWIDRWLTKNVFLAGNGVIATDGNGTYAEVGTRAQNVLVDQARPSLGGSHEKRIANGVIDPSVFWSCNTCMACVEACPVGINHVDHIVGNRRSMVLMHGEVPTEAQSTLRALESQGNPFGSAEDRIKWHSDLEVHVVKPGDSIDYLYWVGCVSAFDPRKQKIARSLVQIMNKAGLSFGILGQAEMCTGDPARRLGEENLYQTLAKQNIETLKSVTFKTIVANCPHCFNTIKNEYPQLGNLGNGRTPDIIHHSVLLQELLAKGKITLKEEGASAFTFHDPCYLGRYNDEYEAPRKTLRSIKGLEIIEMERSKEKGLCCGAGGGHFWMDLKIGERVNTIRVEEAAKTGAHTIATACPFCMQMMEDGTKLTGKEKLLDVRDIAEVIAERLA